MCLNELTKQIKQYTTNVVYVGWKCLLITIKLETERTKQIDWWSKKKETKITKLDKLDIIGLLC